MAIVLFDTPDRKKLFPFTYNHAMGDLRTGIYTFREWWQQRLQQPVFVHTVEYLQSLYRDIPNEEHLWIAADLIADDALIEQMLSLDTDQVISDDHGLVAVRTHSFGLSQNDRSAIQIPAVRRLHHPWQIFQWNDEAIREDLSMIQKQRRSAKLSSTNTVIGNGELFVEEGAQVEHCFLNTSTGPIYIGKDAIIMEGSMIRGPFAMLNNAIVKMGTRIYGATTLGPCCVAGGELKNVVMQGYSNKAHDGYLGDSVIGEWCNLGAGTSNSNVKNTGGNVKIWNPNAEMLTEVGQKCGLIMGDYSRTAINTSMNTGSFVGICCNIFDEGFPPKTIPNFTWGGKGLSKYEFEKAMVDIANWKKMKNADLSPAEAIVLKYIFEKGAQ